MIIALAIIESMAMKGVFSAREDSSYDDRIEKWYHFPNRYLADALKLVGDWIIYHEPGSNGGRKAYIAAAFVERIEPDPRRANHSYAYVSQYLPFAKPVPIQHERGYLETGANLTSPPGIYFRGTSIRIISETDFAAITMAGMRDIALPENERLMDADESVMGETVLELLEEPVNYGPRPIETILLNRPIRDISFRHNVRRAYDFRCAVTGLNIRNGGGRPEVQAAHIQSVEDGGPDIVRNGIALSQTPHWMFDRGLIGVRDDYSLIVSHNKVPPEYRALFGDREKRIHLPREQRFWPDPYYLAAHRDKHCL